MPESQRQVRRNVNIMEMAMRSMWRRRMTMRRKFGSAPTEVFPYEDDGVSYNEMEGKEPVSDPFHYQEWDYHVQLYRPGLDDGYRTPPGPRRSRDDG